MRYSIENDTLRLTVDTHGAEAVSVIHKPTGAELLWSGDPSVWGRHAPILFPYTGALTGGFFGDFLPQLVGIIDPDTTFKALPSLFTPLDDTITILIGAMTIKSEAKRS